MSKKIEIKGHLSQQQIKNYVNGLLMREENHLVEDHLLHCDLCADAVEGYQKFPQAVDIEQNWLSEDRSKNGFGWKGIAAAVLLLISATVAYFSIFDLSTQDQYNITLNQEDTPTHTPNPKGIGNTSTKEKKSAGNEIDTQAVAEEKDKIAFSDDKPIEPKQVPAEKIKDRESGSVINEDEKPSGNQMEAEEYSENEKFRAKPMQALSDEMFKRIEIDGKDDKQNEPVMQEEFSEESLAAVEKSSDLALQERTKKVKNFYTSANRNNQHSEAVSSGFIEKAFPATIMPEGGWKAFEDYLQKNTSDFLQKADTLSSGNVLLEVNLPDADAEPRIKLVKGLNDPCNKVAIKLIKEGPKWVIVDNNTQLGPLSTIVTVHFKLD